MEDLFRYLRFPLRLAGSFVDGVATIAVGTFRAAILTAEVVHAHRRLAGGLQCPRGHEVETEGGTFACGSCGFVYEGGSQWLCPNPECRATTPYVACPTCGLSVSSPYRFLHG